MTIEDLESLASMLTARAAGRPRLVISIDGLGGSGKSTIGRALASVLQAAVVEGDDFYRTSAERSSPTFDRNAIGASVDWERLRSQVFVPAAAGAAVRYQRYDWDNDRLGDWVAVPATQPIIVEGVYVTRPELRDYVSTTLWVETERSARLARGLERDGEDARSLWVDEWMPAEDRYVAAIHPEAASDIVLDGSGTVEHDPARSVVVLRYALPPSDPRIVER